MDINESSSEEEVIISDHLATEGDPELRGVRTHFWNEPTRTRKGLSIGKTNRTLIKNCGK